MLLDKILLENITVHKQTVIEFKEGVNVLSGLNGTGKTTILNMIGYAMFNYLPQNQREYVRRAKNARNYGTVKLWFTGKEGEQFSIKRTLGKTSNLRIVKHVATGMAVDNINSESDFESWLKDHLSLDQACNLGDLFNNAIGVPQGTFTAPFLFTASRRKKIFGPILNLEIYETFYRNYRDVNNLFTEEINKIENQASRLKGSISDKEQLLSKRREIKSKLESEKVKRKELSGKLERITGEIESLSKDKQHLESLEDMKLKDENRISSLEESMKILKRQRDDARKAKKICDDTIGEHQRYLELKDREQELRKLERELLPAKEEKHHHDTAIATLKTSVEQLEQEITNIQGQKAAFKELQDIHSRDIQLGELIAKKREQLATLEDKAQQLDTLHQQLSECQATISRHRHLHEREKELQDQIAVMGKLQDELSTTTGTIASIEKEISILKENKQKAGTGNCPFLEEPCKNIGMTSLSDYFEKKISKKVEDLNQATLECTKLEEKLEKMKERQQELEKLNTIKVKVENAIERRESLKEEIQKLEGMMEHVPTAREDLSSLQAERNEIKPKVTRYHVIREKIKNELPKLVRERNMKKMELHEKIKLVDPLISKIRKLDDIQGQLETLEKQVDALEPSHEAYTSHEKVAGKVKSLENELNEKINQHSSTLADLKQITKELTILKSRFSMDEFNEKEKEREALQIEYKGMEERMRMYTNRLMELAYELRDIREREEKLRKVLENQSILKEIDGFSRLIREWYRDAQPKITEALLGKINQSATRIFQQLFKDNNIEIEWEEDYDVLLKLPGVQKHFQQLSGGEQMAVAIAIRLALLKILTSIDFAFFDEPTTNLDEQKRVSLATCIQNLTDFRQLFVISHDDTFEGNADFVIHFTRNPGEACKVEYLP